MASAWCDELCRWVIRSTLAGVDLPTLLNGICERLEQAGHRPLRAMIASAVLDPVIGGRGIRWRRGSAPSEEHYPRTVYEDPGRAEWFKSPFYAMIQGNLSVMRRHLDGSHQRGEYPLLDQFQDEGATDYLALLTLVSDRLHLGDFKGFAISVTTDQPDGFAESLIDDLEPLREPLSLAVTLHTTRRIAHNLLETYLGRGVANEVLAGNIDRGRARSIPAVIWYSDLAGFTRIADTHDAASTLEFLNAYAEVVVNSIEDAAGEVLKFIGDGMLAIFHADGTAHARAVGAVTAARQALIGLGERRRAAGLPTSRWHVALHDGEIIYGNFGSVRRLDFTALGPAVNEAARMEALSRTLEQEVVISEAFAAASGQIRDRLLRLGRYALKGVAQPQELFTLELD